MAEETQTSPLIRTRLHRPLRADDLIDRTRLPNGERDYGWARPTHIRTDIEVGGRT